MDYEINFHGVEHSDYFPGVGTAFTEWEHVYVGIGNDTREAYEDAQEGFFTGFNTDFEFPSFEDSGLPFVEVEEGEEDHPWVWVSIRTKD